MDVPDVFAEILARKLEPDERAVPPSAQGPFRTTPFESRGSRDTFRPRVLDWLSDACGPYAAEPPTSSDSTTVLTHEQREALSQLRALGATLDDGFNRSQLKTVFRRLALTLHPDRHPGADPQAREQLSARFSILCDAYRTLNPDVAEPRA